MNETEEQISARIIGDLLTSAMMQAYSDHNPAARRTWLYGWEREGLQWLLRFKDRRPDGSIGSAWMHAFIDLNKDAINKPDGTMDFNLKRARLAKEKWSIQGDLNPPSAD